MSCDLCPHCRAEQARLDALGYLAGALREVRNRKAVDAVAATISTEPEVVYEEVGAFTVTRRKRPWDRPDYGQNGKRSGVIDFLDGHEAAVLGESPRCPRQIIDKAEWRKGWRQGKAEYEEQEQRQREWADWQEVHGRRG